MSQSFHQVIDNYNLHCIRFGSGDKLMVAFHGFGDNAQTFEAIEPSLEKHYTIISVDLPFHGLSEWKAGERFTPRQAQQLLQELKKKHNVDVVSLAAFSIGGKIALKLFEMNPEKIESMWLFAPDGLKNNFWYNIAVYKSWGRKLFRYLLDKPKLVLRLLKLLYFIRIFPKSFTKFLEPHILDFNMRERVWNTWLGIAGFEISSGRLKELFNSNKTRCYIFMGQYDPVIKPRIGKRFAKGLSNVELTILPKGHALLKPYLNEYIEQILKR